MLINTFYRDPNQRTLIPLPGRLWKRVPNRPRDRRIGSPTLLETTFDEKILESLQEVQTLNRRPTEAAGLGLHVAGDPSLALPPLPFRSMEPTENSHSHLSVASSVYSQPSPEFQHDFTQVHPPSSFYTDYDIQYATDPIGEISPPDSPTQENRHDWRGSPNISPIQEEPSDTESEVMKSRMMKSGIPVSQGGQSQETTSKASNAKKIVGAPTFDWKSKLAKTGGAIRWDDYSGEPTDGENGKQSKINPKNAMELLAESNKSDKLSLRFQKGLRDDQKESIAARRNKWRQANTPGSSPAPESALEVSSDHTPSPTAVTRKPIERKTPTYDEGDLIALPQREPWKGASGRQTLVTPVVNTPQARTKPVEASRLPTRRPVPSPQSPGQKSPPASTRPAMVAAPNHAMSGAVEQEEEPIKPIVPLKAGGNSPPHVSPTYSSKFRSASGPAVPMRSSMYSNVDKPLPAPKGAENPPDSKDDAARPSTPISDAEMHEQMDLLHLHEKPVSRFSATTYAPTLHDSPPGTPRMGTEVPVPPVPADLPLSWRSYKASTPPTSYDSPGSGSRVPVRSQDPSGILNRKRPIASQVERSANNPYTYITTRPAIRKPTPQASQSSICSNDAGYGQSKALPVSPPELEAPDRVTQLQARLDNLQRRRQNLQTILKELTQVVQPSSVGYDLASRAEVKKTVASLEAEKADILKEEHDVGLKLHRAWKKRDEENAWGGGGGLWVRRITS